MKRQNMWGMRRYKVTAKGLTKWTPMLLLLLLVVCSVLSGVRLCLQCERTVKLMYEDFVLSESDALKQIELQKIVDYAYVTFRETSESRMGVVDLTTLYRARTEYQSEFHHFLKRTTGTTNEAVQIMEKGRQILEQHLDTFIPDGLCPNKCGLLIRRVMDCTSCLYRTYTCPSPLDKRTVELERSDFKVLVVTQDSSVVLNQLHVKEGGTYQCSLQNQTGTVFYKVKFLLLVAASPTKGQDPVVTLPSLQYGHSLKWREALVPVICVVTACCLAASLGLAILLRMIWKEQNVKRLQEENPVQKLLIKNQI